MSEIAFFIALVLTCGYIPLVLVTFPLILFPIWLPARVLCSTLYFGSRQADPGRVYGSAIALAFAVVLLTFRIPELATAMCPFFFASALLPWFLSGKNTVEARRLRTVAALGILVPILWCICYYSLGGEFVLFVVS